jgi:hypothetical protein
LTKDDLRDRAQDAELGGPLRVLRRRLLGCLVALLGVDGERQKIGDRLPERQSRDAQRSDARGEKREDTRDILADADAAEQRASVTCLG